MIQILGLLGIMYFDAVVVFVTNSSLLFRLAMAILWSSWYYKKEVGMWFISTPYSSSSQFGGPVDFHIWPRPSSIHYKTAPFQLILLHHWNQSVWYHWVINKNQYQSYCTQQFWCKIFLHIQKYVPSYFFNFFAISDLKILAIGQLTNHYVWMF